MAAGYLQNRQATKNQMDNNSINIFELNKIIQEIEQKRLRREKVFGKVPPPIFTNLGNYKFVAVGNTIIRSDKWKTFPDFLYDYLWHILGSEWYKNESQKPFEDQNEILKWYNKTQEFSSKQKPNDAGIISVKPNGMMAAYTLLAYDLYTVLRSNLRINSLIKRLKDKNQFQGARYELFCLAACIRGGFEIILENEKDPSKKHVEFVIHDKDNSLKLSVEAKSKHRSGVLGYPGDKIEDDKIRIGNITNLINNAISKDSSIPLVIFIEFNLPPQYAEYFIGGKKMKKVIDIFNNVKKTNDNKDIFNLAILTNHPHHYGKDNAEDPGKMYSLVYSLNPLHPIKNKSTFDKLVYATLLYGNIPKYFEDL